MSSYPVSFEVTRPDQFARFHLLVRLLILAALTMFGVSVGWSFLLLLLVLPAVAAVQTSLKGSARFLAEDGPAIAKVLRWVLALYAYLALLTDKLPDRGYADNIHFAVEPQGSPTPGSALWRLVGSLPALGYLLVLGLISGVLWVLSMVLVGVTGQYPASFFELQTGIYRFLARVLAYHGSLVEAYPPFTLRPDDKPHEDDLSHGKPA